MASRPKLPAPAGEMTPQELADRIRDWAVRQGYDFELKGHATEFGKAIVRDPAGGFTLAVIPNPHHSRRLKKHQIRFTVKDVNTNWEG
jgi:hypothetical protein